jgi:truncated hemoglobin YjbI
MSPWEILVRIRESERELSQGSALLCQFRRWFGCFHAALRPIDIHTTLRRIQMNLA